MKKHIRLMAASALAVSGMTTWTWAGGDKAKADAGTDKALTDQAQPAGDRLSDTADRASDTAGEKSDKVLSGEGLDGTVAAPDAEGIRDVLAQVAEATLTENGLNDVTERFVDADRNRIGEAIQAEDEAYNTLVKQFRDAWKAKYNQDFDITNEEMVYKPEVVSIMQSEIGEGARLAGERATEGAVDVDVNADANSADKKADANADINVTNNTGVDAPGTGNPESAADRNLNDAGRNIATVTIPESHGMPKIKVPMVHEMPDSWRIDIPDTIDAAGLRASATQSLQKCLSMQAEWPADVNDAYLAVSHTILAGLFESQDKAAGAAASDSRIKSDTDAAGTGALSQ